MFTDIHKLLVVSCGGDVKDITTHLGVHDALALYTRELEVKVNFDF